MAILTLPDIAFRSVRYRWQSPAMVNRSPWTGARQVMTLPGPTRLMLSATHVDIRGEAGMRPWRAFFAGLLGQVHSFRMPVTETPQVAAGVTGTVRVAAPALATSAEIAVAGATGTVLDAGQFLTIADQPLLLMAPLVVDGAGRATASFRAPLRKPAAAGAAVVLHRPTALVAMESDTAEWAVDPGQSYGFSFEAGEAF